MAPREKRLPPEPQSSDAQDNGACRDFMYGSGTPLIPPEDLRPGCCESTAGRNQPRCCVMTNVVVFSFLFASGLTWGVIEAMVQGGYYFDGVNPWFRNIPAMFFICVLIFGSVFDLKRRLISGIVEMVSAVMWLAAHIFYVCALDNLSVFGNNHGIMVVLDVCAALLFGSVVVGRVFLTKKFDAEYKPSRADAQTTIPLLGEPVEPRPGMTAKQTAVRYSSQSKPPTQDRGNPAMM